MRASLIRQQARRRSTRTRRAQFERIRRWATVAVPAALYLALFALPALAAGPARITIHGTEFFPADGGPGSITFVAVGGAFGSGTNGTGVIVTGAPAGQSPRAFHGVDMFTTASGTLTFSFRLNCTAPTATTAQCSGTWHIIDSSGAYAGSQGGGSVSDFFVTDQAGNTTGDDTWTGEIQLH